MMFTARFEGRERFARRLEAIKNAPSRSGLTDQAAATVARAFDEVADDLSREGIEASVRIERGAGLDRNVVIEGRGLWERENGSRALAGDEPLGRALDTVKPELRRGLAEGARRAFRAASRAVHAGADG